MNTNKSDTWIQLGGSMGKEVQLGKRKSEDSITEEEIGKQKSESSSTEEEILSDSCDSSLEDGERPMTSKEYREFSRSMERSEGFDAVYPEDPTVGWAYGMHPVSQQQLRYEAFYKELVDFALAEYKISKGEDLELVKIVKANQILVAGVTVYFTIKAKPRGSNNTDMIKIYQVKVYDDVRRNPTLELFREASYPLSFKTSVANATRQ